MVLGIFGLSWCVLGFIQAFCGNLLGVGVRVLGPFEGVGVLGGGWDVSVFLGVFGDLVRSVPGCSWVCFGMFRGLKSLPAKSECDRRCPPFKVDSQGSPGWEEHGFLLPD